jgi:putative transcriptional regulator
MRKNISETIREEMKDLYDAGIIDEMTMRQFDKNSLEPAKAMSKNDVKRIRSKTHTSQPVFASYLNVTPAAVKQWENGERTPSGASVRLLQLIERKGLELFEPIQAISQTKRAVVASALQKSAVTKKTGRRSSDIQERRR